MSKHTPGPWSYEIHKLSEGYSGIVYAANGMRVGTDHLSEANAKLIAAAPTLLEALERAFITIGRAGGNTFESPYRQDWEYIRRILSEAKS